MTEIEEAHADYDQAKRQVVWAGRELATVVRQAMSAVEKFEEADRDFEDAHKRLLVALHKNINRGEVS